MTIGDARQRWRLVFAHPAGQITQRDIEEAWEASLVRSGLPWLSAASGRPRPRMTFAAPLPVGVAGEAELLEFHLLERLRRFEVREPLQREAPPGDTLVDVHDVWLGAPGLPSLVIGADYRVDLARTSDTLDRAIRALLAAATLVRERRKGDRVRTFDLRRLVDTIELERSGERAVLRMRLRHDADLGSGRPDEVLAALEELGAGPIEPAAIARERLRLADD